MSATFALAEDGMWLHGLDSDQPGDSRWRYPLGRARLPALLALLGPELDRLLAGQLPALLEQRRLTAGHHFPEGHLQALAPAVVAPWPEVQPLSAVAQPAFLG
jgi:hypothetical protein